MLVTASHFAQVPTFWKSLASQVISKLLKVLPSLHLTLFLFPGGLEDRVQPWRGFVLPQVLLLLLPSCKVREDNVSE